MLTSGSIGSALEHGIFEQLYSVPSVSTVKILQLANEQGIAIYNINASNVEAILPRLQVSQEVKDAIRNAVAQGREVIIPERNIQYYNWTGVGYIVLDPETGAGAYMISGGLAGGSWALIMKCFKEIKDFVSRFKDNVIGYIVDLLTDVYNIWKAPVSWLEKGAAYGLLFLVYFHIGVYLYTATYAAILGVGFLEIFLLFIVFLIITIALYILMKIIIGDPAFRSCRELII